MLLMIRKIFLKTIFLVSLVNLKSQDIHFSQFWEPLAFTNPSIIGNFDGNIKLSAQHRSQWSQFNTPLSTTFCDVTVKLPKEKSYWAFAGSFMKDQLSHLSYHQARMFASISHHKNFSESFQGGLGFQVGTRMTSIAYDKLTYDRQWDPNTGRFEPSNPSFESFNLNSVLTPFVNIGFSLNLYQKKILHTFDFSTMYISENKITDFVFYQPILIHTNYHNYIPVGKSLTLMPKVGFIYTASANSINSGLLLKYNLGENSDVYGGLLYRWGIDRNPDAVIPVVGCKLGSWRLGVSYDNTTSGINQESKKNAYEVILNYVFKFPKNKYFSIDCMRL